MWKNVSSMQNPAIKRLQALEKPKQRKEEGLFIVEGVKEVLMALDNGYCLTTLYLQEGLEKETTLQEKVIPQAQEIILVQKDIFEKISYRGNTSKAIGLCQTKPLLLSELSLSENPLLLILDGIEKPGNIGAMIRTADAAGIDAVICCNLQADIYNPNVIRSSVGCLFTIPLAVATPEETILWLRQQQINIYVTSLKAAKSYLTVSYKEKSAIVLGTEATGVNPLWENESNANIIIPMRGQNDSLNVSNTAAILLFEAIRQRGL